MTREEFEAQVIPDLLAWISSRTRPESAWYLSVGDWASWKFNLAYDKEHPKTTTQAQS